MQYCKYNNCKCYKIVTNDGYCSRHYYYSNTDTIYICKHIYKYIKKVAILEYKIEKLEHIIKLWNYLQYKIDFINNNNNLKNQIKFKSSEYLQLLDSNNDIPIELKNNFISINNILINQLN